MRLERSGNAGLLLRCALRRSEVVGLNLDQLQSREGRWVIVNLVGKGKRLRTIPVPSWSKELLDAWLQHSGVIEGKVFRRVLKGGMRQEAGVTASVVWYAVKRCASQAGIANLAPHDLRRYAACGIAAALAPGSAMVVEANWNRFSFCLATFLCKQRRGTLDANRSCKMRSMIDLEFQSHAKVPEAGCFFGLHARWIRSFHIRPRLPRPAYRDFPRYCA
jgi:hypothetical protein